MTKSNFTDNSDIIQKKQNLVFFALCVFVSIFCFFGGAEPNLNFNLGLMFVSSVFLIFAIAVNNSYSIFSRTPSYVKYLFMAPIILPLIQLIPMPTDILANLPGQELRFEVLLLVGENLAWQPLTLAPKETAYTAAMSIFFIGFLIACIAVERSRFDFLVRLLVMIAIISAMVGALQSSGAYPFLKFYNHAHNNALTGFFANKNHMALILSVSLILSKNIIDKQKWKYSRFLFFAFTIFISISVIATNSRAGLFLVIIAIIITNYTFLKNIPKKIFSILLSGTSLLIYYISFSASFNVVYARFSDVSDDGRWSFLVNSTSMLRDFLFFGSGYGSFSSIYMIREGIGAVSPFYTNQLHNDFLQIIIEGGLLSLVALALLAFTIFKAWRASAKDASSRGAARTGLAIIVLFAAHSVVDYPLRRPAAIVYFCVGLAYLIRELLPKEGPSPNKIRPSQTA